MTRKRSPQSPRRKLILALAIPAGALLLFLALRHGLRAGAPAVPSPDSSAMEPQVAAKIDESREAVLAAPGSHEAWGRLCMVLHAHRLEADAVACYRRATELAPGEFRWRYLLAHALRDSDPAGALAEAEASSRLDPDYAPAYVLRGQLLESQNAADSAIEQYRKAAELDRENPMAEFGLGRLYLAKGETQDALFHLLRARDLAEDSGAIHGALAQTYRQLGDLDSALAENRLASDQSAPIAIRDPIHYAMRKESLSSTALLERALDADGAGDFETAETLFRDLERLRPDDANIHARFGDVLARQSKIGQAKEQYEKALSINAGIASAHYGLGNMLNFEGAYEAADSHYRAALEASPEHVSALVNLASLLAFRGELDESEELCRKAVELSPRSYAPNFQLGRLMVQKGSFNEAIYFLRAALETRPDSGPAHRQLSIALVGIGDYPSAWKHVQRAQELGETIPPPLVDELRRRAQSG